MPSIKSILVIAAVALAVLVVYESTDINLDLRTFGKPSA